MTERRNFLGTILSVCIIAAIIFVASFAITYTLTSKTVTFEINEEAIKEQPDVEIKKIWRY